MHRHPWCSYLAIWIVFLSSDTTRKGLYPVSQVECTPHVLRCHVKVTSRCLSSVTYVDWVDSVLISMFVELHCKLGTIAIHPQFYLRVCSCNHASFGCSSTFARHHGVDSTMGLLCQGLLSLLDLHLSRIEASGHDVYQFVRVVSTWMNFPVFLRGFVTSANGKFEPRKRTVSASDHFVVPFPTNTVSRACQTFIVPFKSFSFTSCDDWCWFYVTNSVITSPALTPP